nr:LOW QUALITY PROTEIN: insulin-like [Danio rerio]|eukprot:XP_009297891.1 LOW QUALITY PROTEIN: insulin-like [Danio rerio]
MQGSGLLLLSLCAGSLLTHSGAGGKRRLCGIQLVEALLIVCGEKGLFHQPWGKRVREHKLRKLPCSGERDAFEKRGIVEQCCHFSCDDLENYCNTKKSPVLLLHILHLSNDN